MNDPKDLIIVGAGIAGVSAAIYAKRSGLDFLIFEPQAVGGQLLLMQDIDNYVGIGLGLKGVQMAQTLVKTLDDLEIEVINERISKAEFEKDQVIFQSEDATYIAKTAIIATGASFKKLGLAKEAKFTGKGISYCAVCDGFFFKGKDVAVVGGGNTAVEEALYLSDIANKVTLIHRRDKLRSLDYLQKQLLAKDNVEIAYNSVVVEPKGKELLEEIIIEDNLTKDKRTIALQGLFVAIGINPATEIFKELVARDDKGFIITDQEMKSSCDLVWACGDCRKRPLKQLITAASEGATAALSAYKHIKGHYISS
ncbi:MAG: FAD-dependent oxidoreductase [Candidatus Omnitrophica bacterium]|nr:FAD-dependent oxidoreductase [Candidatus Omnitrophota bacterium]